MIDSVSSRVGFRHEPWNHQIVWWDLLRLAPTILHLSGDLNIMIGFSNASDLHTLFCVSFVAVAVNAIMLTEVFSNPLLSPYSFLNSLPLDTY